jgi:hypothetical protein
MIALYNLEPGGRRFESYHPVFLCGATSYSQCSTCLSFFQTIYIIAFTIGTSKIQKCPESIFLALGAFFRRDILFTRLLRGPLLFSQEDLHPYVQCVRSPHARLFLAFRNIGAVSMSLRSRRLTTPLHFIRIGDPQNMEPFQS